MAGAPAHARYRPRNNITQEPVSDPPAAHCQATDKLPSISHDRRRVVGLHRSARVGMNADEGSMTTRFPSPWRIVELPNGFAVEDATGRQIGVFYGRAPNSAGHTGIMTMDEARQMAVDFASLPELLKQDGNGG